ncbi:MAG: hypothetical protein Q8R24_04845 [Legionellaceae bacterium]|nr:hypothetical protein [Legionellaceae bacterium]
MVSFLLKNGISFIDKKDVIGFAAEGAYKTGWSRVTEAFHYKHIGNCNYNIHNMKISHAGVKLFQEYVTYDINTKPSIIYIEGIPGMGFSYNVEWYDNNFAHKLTCAQHEYTKKTIVKLILLAKRLDSEQETND